MESRFVYVCVFLASACATPAAVPGASSEAASAMAEVEAIYERLTAIPPPSSAAELGDFMERSLALQGKLEAASTRAIRSGSARTQLKARCRAADAQAHLVAVILDTGCPVGLATEQCQLILDRLARQVAPMATGASQAYATAIAQAPESLPPVIAGRCRVGLKRAQELEARAAAGTHE